jgi:hypothetical protein
MGVRAHHLEVEDVAVAERTSHGDGRIRLGAVISDPSHILLFDADGRRAGRVLDAAA